MNLVVKIILAGDGVTTFKVPNLLGEFLRGTGTNSYTNQGSGANVGVHQDNGLPNITGTFTDCGFDWWPSSSGAFYYKKECSR